LSDAACKSTATGGGEPGSSQAAGGCCGAGREAAGSDPASIARYCTVSAAEPDA